MSPRCLSTLADLPEEGYSARALARLADRRKLPARLAFTRAEVPAIRAGTPRLSISGVQGKVSLRLVRGRFEPVEVGGGYILKPVPSGPLPAFHQEVPANEHVTMQLAEQLFSIRTAPNALVRLADGELAYLTRRFDRTPGGGRLWQHDFCQLMGRTPRTHGPQYKYDSSYEALGNALRACCAAWRVEVEELFRRIVHAYAFGNGDAHLRNFSVLEAEAGDYLLSPAYDLVASTLHLPGESRLALDLFDGDEIPAGVLREGFETGRDLLELARRFGMREDRARAVLVRVGDRRDAVHALVRRSFLTEPAQDAYLRIFDDRVKALSLERRAADKRRRKVAADYAAGIPDAVMLLAEGEPGELEVLGDEGE